MKIILKENTIAGQLSKIVWTAKDDIERYSLLVIDRKMPGGVKTIKLGGDVKILKDRIIAEGHIIPLHRIVAIMKDGVVIWGRGVYQKK